MSEMFHMYAHDADEIIIKRTETDKSAWTTIRIGGLEICVWATSYAEKEAPLVTLVNNQPWREDIK